MPKFEQFIRGRQYLHNVYPATVSWHTYNLKWLSSETPTENELKAMDVRMREKGLRATGCSSAIRSINAYLKWAGSPLKIPQMKEPQGILLTYSATQLQLLLGWKPRKVTGHRLSTLISLLAETGCRIDEALSLHWKDIDFDNLLVPMSLELRKRLFVFQRKTEANEGRHSRLKSARNRDAETFYGISNSCAGLSGLSRQHGASTRCGTRLRSIIYGRVGRCFTSRGC